MAPTTWSERGRNWWFALMRPAPTSISPWCTLERAPLVWSGERLRKTRSPFITAQIISGETSFPDTTNTAHPGTIIGYGGPGSPNTNNRTIQQVTFDWIKTLFGPIRAYGALQTYAQYSYLTRSPWYVAPGTPKNAHLSMVYFGVRYILPTTSGTLLRVPRPN